MLTTYINGKFACQHTTGVQRTALGLLRALDMQLCGLRLECRGRWVLLCPPGAVVPALSCIEVEHVGRAGQALSWWEQWHLPMAARRGRLLNLAGSAPALARRQICMLHDAAVFDRPQAYTFVFRTWYRLLFSWLSRSASQLLTVSEFSRRQLSHHLRLPPERLIVVPNGANHLLDLVADPCVLSHFGIEAGRYVLAVGGANPNKNLPALELAVHRLFAQTGLRLIVVGGINRKVFSADADSALEDSHAVLRLGPVDDAQLKALYQNALALVFPSIYEGFGLPPLEAMSCGCPVAASNAAAIPEVCGDGAVYFSPHSTAEIEAILRRLLDEPELRASLRAAGSLRWVRFRWETSASAILDRVLPGCWPGAPGASL